MNRIFILYILIVFSLSANGQVKGRILNNIPEGKNLCIQWSSRQGVLFAGATNGQIFEYNLSSGSIDFLSELGTEKIYALSVDKGGKLYAAYNENVTLVTAEDSKFLNGHDYMVSDIAVSRTDGLIASSSRDNSIIIWSPSGSFLRQIRGHNKDVVAIAFSPDGEKLASASEDNTVKIWETNSGSLIQQFSSASNIINDLVFSHDGTKLFAAGNNGIVVVWSTRDWVKLFSLELLQGPLYKLSISRDDRYLSVAGESSTIAFYDLIRKTKELFDTPSSSIDIQFSPDGSTLAALLSSGNIIVWDILFKNIGPLKYPYTEKKPLLILRDVRLTERNINGIIEPGDQPELRFVVENSGVGRAYDVNALIKLSGNTQGIKINEKIALGEIDTGIAITRSVGIDLGNNLISSNTTIEIFAIGANDAKTEKKSIPFQTKGAGGLAYMLISDPVFYTPEGIVRKGLPLTMRYKLRNIGTEAATKVSVKFKLPDHVIAANKLIASYDYIEVNSSLEDSLLFYAGQAFEGGKIDVEMQLNGVTTGQELSMFSVRIGQDLRLKPEFGVSKPLFIGGGQGQNYTDPRDYEYSVDTDIPLNPVKSEYRIAFIVGNENYRDYNTKVEFAGHDARIFKEYASRLMGVHDENLFYLLDASADEWRKQLERLQKLMSLLNGKAEVIFYFSGAVIVDDYFRDEYLLPVDLRTSRLDEYFTFQNIMSLLTAPKHLSVTAFVDGTRLFESRLKPLNEGTAPRNFYLYGNARILKATSGKQSAAGNEKMNHGLFTYYLLKKLKLDRQLSNLDNIASYTENQVKQACFRLGIFEQSVEYRNSF